MPHTTVSNTAQAQVGDISPASLPHQHHSILLLCPSWEAPKGWNKGKWGCSSLADPHPPQEVTSTLSAAAPAPARGRLCFILMDEEEEPRLLL